MHDRKTLEAILEKAKRTLAILEGQAAAYGSLSVPVHIQIQLEDQRKLVEGYEKQLAELNGSSASSGQPTQSNSSNPVENSIHNTSPNSARSKVFISYSHEDKDWLDRLQVFLKPLERKGKVARWDDTLIKPGMKWREEIEKALASAKVAVFLVSADFLASDFIDNVELPSMLQAAEKEGAVVIPVIVRPCLFRESPLYQYQSVNSPSKPLSGMSRTKQDEMLGKIAEAITAALES